jgi:hypothetical protein
MSACEYRPVNLPVKPENGRMVSFMCLIGLFYLYSRSLLLVQ